MLYLSRFTFPSQEEEYDFLMPQKLTCYDSYYPFQILAPRGVEELEFEPLTILYGGNGSGKTTALNVIAEALGIKRDALYNRTNFFPEYLQRCHWQIAEEITEDSRIVTSDDVFDFMLNLRQINEGVHAGRKELFEDYAAMKYASRYRNFKMQTLSDYEELKQRNAARRLTESKFVREYLPDNIREHSNGESAFLYFTEKIQEHGLYLLDEPENSLSPARQRELASFLEDSVRFFGCQLIIATHSPFLLAMKGARVYDLDEKPVRVKPWTKLENVRAYRSFFKEHEGEF